MAEETERKRRRHSEQERALLLRDADQLGVAEAARLHGLPQSTLSNWRHRGARQSTSVMTERVRPATTSAASPTRRARPHRAVGDATRGSGDRSRVPSEGTAAANTKATGGGVARSYTPSEKARALEHAAEHGV
jgi:transposase-like protein